MKRVLIALLLVAILIIPAANADLFVLARFKPMFSEEALEAASKAQIPDELEGLNSDMKELFELGFAAGYDAAIKAKTTEITYILNTKSMKFHLPNCLGVRNMKEENRQETTKTREELISQGYEPCGTCKP